MARAHARIHLLLEEAVPAPFLLLGPVERQVGILQKLVGVGAVGGRHSDADADPDYHLKPLREPERLVHPGDDLPREIGSIGR